jgi:hypothetical protein
LPLFNNAAVAASFEMTGIPKQTNKNNPNQGKKNRNGVVTSKFELMKQELLTGVTVLWLVLPMTNNNHYMDIPEATTKQALDTIIGVIKYQEENLELVENQEQMEEWQTQDNIKKLGPAMAKNYFQQGSGNVGSYNKGSLALHNCWKCRQGHPTQEH